MICANVSTWLWHWHMINWLWLGLQAWIPLPHNEPWQVTLPVIKQYNLGHDPVKLRRLPQAWRRVVTANVICSLTSHDQNQFYWWTFLMSNMDRQCFWPMVQICCSAAYFLKWHSLLVILCIQGSYRSRKTGKSRGIWLVRESQGESNHL